MAGQTYERLNVVVVDDKSKKGHLVERLCKNYDAKYIRNPASSPNSQRALVRNIGLWNSTGDIIVFSDMDMILHSDSIERHFLLHKNLENIVLCCQIWNIEKAVDIRRLSFTEEALKAVSKPFIHDESICWSGPENIHRSNNWWAFLSGHCSFKRHDIMRLNGWDPFFEGWGGEDNEMGYRVILNGMNIIYTDYVKAFQIWREVKPEEQYLRSKSVLRNIDYMCRKFPELYNYNKLIERRMEVEDLRLRYEEERGSSRKR